MGTQTQFLKLYKPVSNEVGWSALVDGNFDVLDTFVRQFMSIPNFQGAWVNAHAYVVGQVALDVSDGNFYKVLIANTSALLPTTFLQDRQARPTLWTLDNNATQGFVQAAANSAAAANASAQAAAANLNQFKQIYYGAFPSDPLVDGIGGARTEGDLYFNTTSQRLRVFTLGGWVEITTGVPEAPANSTTFGRNNNTWVNVIPVVGRTQISGVIAHESPLPPAATSGQFLGNVIGGFNLTGNLYFDITIGTTGGWRYRAPTANASIGWIITEAGNASLSGAGPAAAANTFALVIGTEHTFVQDQIATLNVAQFQIDINGSMAIAGANAFKPGGGLWATLSDSRVKTVVGPYPRGLAELLEMLPKMFTYKGNDNYLAKDGSMGLAIHPDTTTQHVGLVAQDCEPYMPELVSTQTAYVDGVLVDDLRTVDATGVIYALVNACAELDARLKALEP